MDQNLIYSFEIMGKGMVSIFVVIILLMLIIMLLAKIPNILAWFKKIFFRKNTNGSQSEV